MQHKVSCTSLKSNFFKVILTVAVTSIVTSTSCVLAQSFGDEDQLSLPSNTEADNTPLSQYWPASSLVHGHFALSQAWIDRPAFASAPQLLESIGAPKFITRHVKGGEEGPWWNTAVPTRFCSPRDRNCEREPAREIITASQQGPKRVIAYYRHLWEKSQSDLDSYVAPEERVTCLDHLGQPQEFKADQKFLSLSSRHKETVRQRMIELARMGYGAVYLDFKHQPEKGCWDHSTREAYHQLTGKQVPEPTPNTTFETELSNPAFRSFLAFNNRQISAAFAEWQAAGRTVNPHFTLLISASYMNSLTTPHLWTNMYPVGSMAKTEFRLPVVRGPEDGGSFHRAPAATPALEESARMAFGYSMLRSATFNTAPHVWLNIARVDPALSTPTETRFFPPTREELSRGAAAILGLGGIANLHLSNEIIYSPSVQEEYRAAFAATKVWDDKLNGKTTAVAHVGVFFSERLRWRVAGNAESFWFQGNLPALASFELLNQEGVPAQVVVDRELSRPLPPYMKVLILNNPREQLTQRQRDQLVAFSARGGRIIDVSGLSWAPASFNATKERLKSQLQSVIGRSFVRVAFPSTVTQRAFTVYSDRASGGNGSKVLAIPNEFSWVNRFGPNEVTVNSVVRGVWLKFPASTTAPTIFSLNEASPRRLNVVADEESGGWKALLPPYSGDLGLYQIQ